MKIQSMPFITLTMMLFILACGDKETDMANDTSTIFDTSDDNDESNTPEDTSSEPSTEDTDTEDTETEDTGLWIGKSKTFFLYPQSTVEPFSISC